MARKSKGGRGHDQGKGQAGGLVPAVLGVREVPPDQRSRERTICLYLLYQPSHLLLQDVSQVWAVWTPGVGQWLSLWPIARG